MKTILSFHLQLNKILHFHLNINEKKKSEENIKSIFLMKPTKFEEDISLFL